MPWVIVEAPFSVDNCLPSLGPTWGPSLFEVADAVAVFGTWDRNTGASIDCLGPLGKRPSDCKSVPRAPASSSRLWDPKVWLQLPELQTGKQMATAPNGETEASATVKSPLKKTCLASLYYGPYEKFELFIPWSSENRGYALGTGQGSGFGFLEPSFRAPISDGHQFDVDTQAPSFKS